MYSESSIFQKLCHFLPVIPVYFIIGLINFGVTRYYIYDYKPINVFKIIFGGMFYLFSFMVLLTHFKSMCTSPGYVQESWTPSFKSNNEKDFCKKCKNDRPPRAHHCKVCERCTLKMDHHCPWIANCVGFGNHKFFYQFLFYATIGNLIAFILLITRLQEVEYNDKMYVPQHEVSSKNNKPEYSTLEIIWSFWSMIMIVTSATVAAAMVLAIGFLFAFQTKLIFTGLTTIENKIFFEASESPWYNKEQFHNFKVVMGTNIFEWFLPIKIKNQYTDGYFFETSKKPYIDVEVNSRRSNYVQLDEIQENKQNSSKLQEESLHY